MRYSASESPRRLPVAALGPRPRDVGPRRRRARRPLVAQHAERQKHHADAVCERTAALSGVRCGSAPTRSSTERWVAERGAPAATFLRTSKLDHNCSLSPSNALGTLPGPKGTHYRAHQGRSSQPYPAPSAPHPARPRSTARCRRPSPRAPAAPRLARPRSTSRCRRPSPRAPPAPHLARPRST